MTEIERAYPPSENEAMNALWQQGLAVMKFYADPTMTVTDLNQTVESILFDLKNSSRAEKYSLNELEQIALTSKDKRMAILYKHEAKHAKQMTKVLKEMGIDTKPEFDVYFCPILADMYQHGNFIGFIEMKELDGVVQDRQFVTAFETRMAVEMLKSVDSSVGDRLIILGVLGGKILGLFNSRKINSLEP